jgi:hypothetical protein
MIGLGVIDAMLQRAQAKARHELLSDDPPLVVRRTG